MTYYCNNDYCPNVSPYDKPGLCGTCLGPLMTTAPTGESLISLVENRRVITIPLTEFETMDEQHIVQLRETLRGDLRGGILDARLMDAMTEAGIKFTPSISIDGERWFDVMEL